MTALDRARYALELDEDFGEARIDPGRWVDHDLPQWTTPERSQARYDVEPGLLRLRIDADQPAWLPEEGELRASNLQSATGPQIHRHRDDMRVRTPQEARALYTPSSGLVEAELRATADPTIMLAFWLVGPGRPRARPRRLPEGRRGPGRPRVSPRLGDEALLDLRARPGARRPS